jgi:hypothetical protein
VGSILPRPRVGLVVSALDSRQGDPGSNPGPVIYWPIRNILGQGVNSQVPRPTGPFIPSGSMIWYQLRLGVNVLCVATGAACG